MLSDQVRARLQQLHRQPLLATDAKRRKAAAPASLGQSGKQDRSKLPPGAVIENASGRHLLIEEPLDSLLPGGGRLVDGAQRHLSRIAKNNADLHLELAAFAEHFPRRTFYLDLETCGFAGAMVFLVGLIRSTDRGLVLSQLLARDYSEERAMFETFWKMAAGHAVVVTFNGKSFDWPAVNDRSTLHHLGRDARSAGFSPPCDDVPAGPLARYDPRPNPIHFDLLHHARRRWRRRLPNCKLQTLERFLCGRYRTGDIPGSEIPAAYHDFVRTGSAAQMRSILHHNALDLVTLLELSLLIFREKQGG